MENLFPDFCSELGLSQAVLTPTRGSALLGLILCSVTVYHVETVNGPIQSDHKLIIFDVVSKSSLDSVDGPAAKLNYRKADYENMQLSLDLTDWNKFFAGSGNIDEMYRRLSDLMHMLIGVEPPTASETRMHIDSHTAKLQAAITRESDAAKLIHLQKEVKKACRGRRVLTEHAVILEDPSQLCEAETLSSGFSLRHQTTRRLKNSGRHGSGRDTSRSFRHDLSLEGRAEENKFESCPLPQQAWPCS